MRISWVCVVAAGIVIVATYRWLRTRYLLYRMIEKMDELLKLEGVDILNFFKQSRLRRLLSLTQLTARLRKRIDLLADQRRKALSDATMHTDVDSRKQDGKRDE